MHTYATLLPSRICRTFKNVFYTLELGDFAQKENPDFYLSENFFWGVNLWGVSACLCKCCDFGKIIYQQVVVSGANRIISWF